MIRATGGTDGWRDTQQPSRLEPGYRSAMAIERHSWGAVLRAPRDSNVPDLAWVHTEAGSVENAIKAAWREKWRTTRFVTVGERTASAASLAAFPVAVVIAIVVGLPGLLPLSAVLLIALVTWLMCWAAANFFLRSTVDGVAGPFVVHASVGRLMAAEERYPAAAELTSRVIRCHGLRWKKAHSHHDLDHVLDLIVRFAHVAERAKQITGPGRQDAVQALAALAGSYDGRSETTAGIEAAVSSLALSIGRTLNAELAVRAEVNRPVREAAEARRADQLAAARNEAMRLIKPAQQSLDADAEAAAGVIVELADGR